MRLIFIGPPGSGKGTQAQLLSQRLSLSHISTGEILREAVRQQTPAGKEAAPYMTAGQLVPDDLVNEIIVSRFRAKDRPDRFIIAVVVLPVQRPTEAPARPKRRSSASAHRYPGTAVRPPLDTLDLTDGGYACND